MNAVSTNLLRNANTRYRLLVMLDFSEASYNALKYAITVAKAINGTIKVVHVTNPGNAVGGDNQTAVLRETESAARKAKNKLQSIVEILDAENVEASYCHATGNTAYVLETQLTQQPADLVVVGKGKMHFKGKLADYLLNQYGGAVLVVNKCTEFRCDTKITFSCTNDVLEKYDPHLLFELDKHTQTPLTLLNVKKPAELSGKIELPFTWQCDKEIAQNIRLESRKSLSVSEGIAKHIACQNAELLCIGRSQRKSFLRSLFFSRYSTMAEIINAVNIPVLLAPLNNGSGMMSLDKQA